MWQRLELGILTSFIFLSVLIVRQYAVIALALSRGIPVRNVTLYVIGGVPGISRSFNSPLVDILLGAAGLLFSLVIVMLLYVGYVLLIIYGNTLMASLFSWLVYFMVLFTFFHIIPGFPLDGGRIFRALLWRGNQDYDQSTRLSAWIGLAASICLICLGVALVFFNQRWIVGGLIIFIGWVTLIATSRANHMMRLRQPLLNTQLSDIILSRDCPQISLNLTIKNLVNDYVINKGHYFFVTTGEGKPIGCMSLREIKKVPKKFWEDLTVEQTCTPATKIHWAAADQSAADILEQMVELDLEQIPVITDNQTIGLLDRDDLLHLSRIRRELKSLDIRRK